MDTPGGPLQLLLVGHTNPPCIAVTTDSKYLVSVSLKVIIWDLSSGEIFREIEPKLEGLMLSLCLTPNDSTGLAHTQNNSVIIFSLLTGEFIAIKDFVEEGDIIGITGSNSHCLVWTAHQWYLYTLGGDLVLQGSSQANEKPVFTQLLYNLVQFLGKRAQCSRPFRQRPQGLKISN